MSSYPDVKVPAGIAGVKSIMPKFVAETAAIGEIFKAMGTGDAAALSTSIDKSKSMMGLVKKLDDYLFAELDVTYVLLTHVIGNEADWNAGKKVRYCASLVNVKTGKMRYFATVEAKKSAIPTPYMAQLGIMSSNLFDSVNEKDALPAKAQNKDTAGLDINVTYY